MASSATVEYNGAQVTSALNQQRTKFDHFAGNARLFNDTIGELAEALLGVEGAVQTEAATAVVRELLDIEAEAKAFGAALAAVQNSYVADERSTDFKQKLEQHAKRLLPSFRQHSDMKQYYQEFCQRLEVEDEEPQQQNDDDIEVQIGGDANAAPNATCPLSLKPIMEIDDPVVDQKGYVYERQVIEEYIRSDGGKTMCPATATSHEVTLANLKKAHKIIRQQRYGTQKQSQADIDVVDVD